MGIDLRNITGIGVGLGANRTVTPGVRIAKQCMQFIEYALCSPSFSCEDMSCWPHIDPNTDSAVELADSTVNGVLAAVTAWSSFLRVRGGGQSGEEEGKRQGQGTVK